MTATVTLPRGLWVDGERRQAARLRPLTGADEEFLLDSSGVLTVAERASSLLARCLVGLGPGRPVPPGTVEALTMGDRDALLLHLRRLTFGEDMDCFLHCPRPECGEPMDLSLSVGELLLPPYESAPETREVVVGAGSSALALRFRLPTVGDIEAAVRHAGDDPEAGARLILRRCLVGSGDGGSRDGPTPPLPPEAWARVGVAMSEADPQAELNLDIACPACEVPFRVDFDPAAYLLDEVAARSRFLHREIHLLAFHYHWSEGEILGMTPRRRQRYLDLLTEELQGVAAQ